MVDGNKGSCHSGQQSAFVEWLHQWSYEKKIKSFKVGVFMAVSNNKQNQGFANKSPVWII